MEPLEVCKLSKETSSSPRVAVTHRPIENKTKFPPFSTHRSLMSVRAGASIVTVVDPPEDGDAFSEFITHNGGGDRIKVVGKPGIFATHQPSECSAYLATTVQRHGIPCRMHGTPFQVVGIPCRMHSAPGPWRILILVPQ